MQQISPYTYEVQWKEEVTLSFSAIGVEPNIAGALDGKPIRVSEGQDFKFVVDKQPGSTYFLILEFAFLPGSDINARYNVKLLGSQGSPSIYSFSVRIADLIHDPDIRFHVVTGSRDLGIAPPDPWPRPE